MFLPRSASHAHPLVNPDEALRHASKPFLHRQACQIGVLALEHLVHGRPGSCEQRPVRIKLVHYDELRIHAGLNRVIPDELCTERVDRADPRRLKPPRKLPPPSRFLRRARFLLSRDYGLPRPAFHLARGLFGESDGDHFINVGGLLIEDVHIPSHENPGLARSRAGRHHQALVEIEDGLLLLGSVANHARHLPSPAHHRYHCRQTGSMLQDRACTRGTHAGTRTSRS